jgi:translation initiation factor 2 beta subunit (eIF-2beta)/eIF-5
VLILADDLGYAELGCQGCKDIPTPNIDSIARNGVRFTQGYVTCPICAPTEVLYWRFFEKRAIGMGDWKLVKEARQAHWELYNLAEDIGETRNLAEKMPKKVKEIEEAWQEWNAQLQPPKWVRQDARTVGRRSANPPTRTGRSINIEQHFRQLDRNGDGKLSRDEVGRPALYRRLDLNGDGFVTLDEAKKVLGVK